MKFDLTEISISDETATFVLGLELVIGENNYNISSISIEFLPHFYYFIVINIIVVDVFHDATQKKNIQKLYCLEYVFQMISFKWL